MENVYIIDNFISKDDSKFLIDYIDKNSNDADRFRQNVGIAFDKGLATRAIFPDEKPPVLFKDLEWIIDKYSKKFMSLCESNFKIDHPNYFYGVSLSKLSEDVQLRIHRDIHNDFSSLSYTSVVYLNDDYEGGEAAFLEDFVPVVEFPLYADHMGGLCFKPASGQASLFKSSQWHGGKKITKGNKYALILWATPDIEYQFEGFSSTRVLNLINYKKHDKK